MLHSDDAGTLALSDVACGIAMGELSPVDGKEWDPPLGQSSTGGPERCDTTSAPAGAPTKRPGTPFGPHPPPPGQRSIANSNDTNNHRKHGFRRLPDADEDYSKWKLDKLREFYSVSAVFLWCGCCEN